MKKLKFLSTISVFLKVGSKATDLYWTLLRF